MKPSPLLITFAVALFIQCSNPAGQEKQVQQNAKTEMALNGKWIRNGHNGLMSITFKNENLVEVDFGDDNQVEVVSGYTVQNDTIIFVDQKGAQCAEKGMYKMYLSSYYVAFDLIDDMCNGRIKSTLGYWVRPEYPDVMKEMEHKITKKDDPELHLERGRMYLALGNSAKAKIDLSAYIATDSTNARAYINRAGTCFPNDLVGVINDCNKALNIEPDLKNAYFLRGLARYGLGEKEQACNDFTKAIDLGFSILRIAEEQRCAEFWDE